MANFACKITRQPAQHFCTSTWLDVEITALRAKEKVGAASPKYPALQIFSPTKKKIFQNISKWTGIGTYLFLYMECSVY